jgi:hypothetical protein
MGRLNSHKPQKFRTICEVHREMYDIVYELPDSAEKDTILQQIEEIKNEKQQLRYQRLNNG